MLFGKEKVGDNTHEEILLRCNCGSMRHSLAVSLWDTEDNYDEDMFLIFQVESGRLRTRIWNAIKHIFMSEDIVIQDIVVRREEMEELVRLLDKYLKKHG